MEKFIKLKNKIFTLKVIYSQNRVNFCVKYFGKINRHFIMAMFEIIN